MVRGVRLGSIRCSALAAIVVAAACGSDAGVPKTQDAGAETADASAPSPDAAIDAGEERACAAPEDCPCFSNYDCPSTHTCTSFDDTGENIFCVEGERGEGVAGEVCTGEASCESALCIEDDSGSFCSDVCEDASTCPAVLPRCVFIGFGVDVSICAP